MEKNGKRILEFLLRDFGKTTRPKEKQELSSEKMQYCIMKYYSEIEEEFGEEISNEEMELLASCYEAELNDSLNSSSAIPSLASLPLAFISIIVALLSVFGLNPTAIFIAAVIYVVICFINLFVCFKLTDKVSKESTALRNRIVALRIYQSVMIKKGSINLVKGKEKNEEE